MSETGIVIVTYNSEREIGPCLDAAMRSGAEIVVVDNASCDGTAAEVKRRGVRLIANASNRGFAGAVNQGFAALNAPYVLLLNPDAVIASSLEPLRAACDLPGSAGGGGLLLDSNGRPQVGFMVRALPTPWALALEALLLNRIWPKNRVNRRYRGLDLDYSRRFAAEQPAGAFLMIRRSVWLELGGLDERFCPLWFEDVDFCRRASDRGYRLYFVPEAVANHTGAHSIARVSVEKRQFYWYRGVLWYAAKHFRPAELRAVSLAIVTGSILRVIAELILGRGIQSVAAYGKVLRLAGRCAVFGWKR
ncbi:MAG TPA: glycosyltransferase family 2 protein [Bryobacteraceae bacterium]